MQCNKCDSAEQAICHRHMARIPLLVRLSLFPSRPWFVALILVVVQSVEASSDLCRAVAALIHGDVMIPRSQVEQHQRRRRLRYYAANTPAAIRRNKPTTVKGLK